MSTKIGVGLGACHGPGCQKPAVRLGGFCSEDCWRTWSRKANAGDQMPAEIVMEWLHPRRGRIREAVCDRHHTELHGALRTLGIGCSGEWAHGEICTRCRYEGKDTRSWIGEAVVPELSEVDS